MRVDFRTDADAVDPVHRAQESGDELGARAQVDIFRRADLFDAAFVHDGQLIGHGERFFLVVRD